MNARVRENLGWHRYFLCFACCIGTFGWHAFANADEIKFAKLVNNGAPESDRIQVQVRLSPETKDVALEVRAYLVQNEPTHSETAIKGSGGDVDSDGNFKMTLALKTAGKIISTAEDAPAIDELGTDMQRSIAVPVDHLQLDKSTKHTIGYVLGLIVEGKSIQVWPLPLFNVIPSDGKNREVTHTTSVPYASTDEAEEIGLSWQDGQYKETRLTGQLTSTNFRSETHPITVGPGPTSASTTKSEVVTLSSSNFLQENQRKVFYATNRKQAAGQDTNHYSSDMIDSAAPLNCGSCVVSIPIHHVKGTLELPKTRYFFWNEPEDSTEHFIIESRQSVNSLSDLVQQLGKDDVLLFVHGYNNSFEDAIFRSAQLQYDLKFGGKSIAFSWPSQGRMTVSLNNLDEAISESVKTAYRQDEIAAERSVQHLMVLLKDLLAKKASSGGKLHIIAHSMGNRVLLRALHNLEHTAAGISNTQIDTVILAAADVDATDFQLCRAALLKSSQRISYYFSSSDGALALSRALHRAKPTGLNPIFDPPAMDTISARGLTSIFNQLGHVYAMQSEKMLTDIQHSLTGLTPAQRPPSKTRVVDPSIQQNYYWRFR